MLPFQWIFALVCLFTAIALREYFRAVSGGKHLLSGGLTDSADSTFMDNVAVTGRAVPLAKAQSTHSQSMAKSAARRQNVHQFYQHCSGASDRKKKCGSGTASRVSLLEPSWVARRDLGVDGAGSSFLQQFQELSSSVQDVDKDGFNGLQNRDIAPFDAKKSDRMQEGLSSTS